MEERKAQLRFTVAFAAIVIAVPFVVYGDDISREPVEHRPGGVIGQIELLVTEPDGTPVQNAHVKAGFYNPRNRQPGFINRTNEQGRCVVSGLTENEIRYRVFKDGYYKSKGVYSCVHAAHKQDIRVKNGYWQPRKPTVSVELRPIRNPIPMYVKEVSGFIPDQQKPCGYDLVEGDWVTPHGEGQTADIVISAEGEYQDTQHRWTKTIFRFPNEHNGLLYFTVSDNKYGNYSDYIIPYYQAPTNGYKSEYTHFSKLWGDIRNNVSSQDNVHFIFRIRSKVNQEDEVVEALYGKIYGGMGGGIEWGGPRIGIGFTYYLNPTGTRNLEYDPPKNLFLQKDDGTFWRPSSPYAREHDEYIRGKP